MLFLRAASVGLRVNRGARHPKPHAPRSVSAAVRRAAPDSGPGPDRGLDLGRGLRTLRIVRPLNALTTVAGVLVGAYLATRPGAPAPPWLDLLLAGACAFAFAAAGNVRNDVEDVDIDRAAHPGRPLPRGELTRAQANALAVALYAVAVASAALLSWLAFALVLVALVLMEAYERAFKARGLSGNVVVGILTGAPFVLGALAAGGAATSAAGGPVLAAAGSAMSAAGVNAAVLALAALAALATAGREVLKDVEDVEADAGRRRTLPMRVGARGAATVAAGFLGVAVLLSPAPYVLETVLGGAYLPAVAAADACFVTAAFLGFSRPAAGQRLAKVGMVVALVALVVGRAQEGGPF